jgi:hypothetical protein
MNASSPSLTFLFAVSSVLMSGQTACALDEVTRVFPEFKCQYTLPGKGWNWVEADSPGSLLFAEGPKGFVVSLAVARVAGLRAGQLDVKAYEEELYATEQLRKRGGQFLTFKGLPCYQAEGLSADGRTTATRAFVAHGLVYNLGVVGGKHAVERDPEFKKILGGFAFTEAPPQGAPPETGPADPPANEPSPAHAIATWMGQLAFVCLLAAFALIVVRWATRKARRSPRPDDERPYRH